MRATNSTFDTYHAKAYKTPKYLIKFEPEDLENWYTEVDPASNIIVGGANSIYTAYFFGLSSNETAYVYRDLGVDYFDDDFTHHFQFTPITHSGDGAKVGIWGMANTLNDLTAIDTANEDYLAVVFDDSFGGNETFFLRECNNGALTTDSYSTVSYGTTYYFTIVRDESIGTYGTLYAYIYSDSDRTTLVDTLSVTLTAANDFRYFYALVSVDDNDNDTVNGAIVNHVLGPDYTNHKASAAHHQKEYLVDISGASQKVTPEEGRASIGGINFSLLDKDNEVTKILASDPYGYHYRKCTAYMGYKGIDESDMLSIMVGRVTGLQLDKDALSYDFDVTDPSREMQRKIFRGSEDTPVSLQGNPINILLQILTSTGNGTNGDYDILAEENGLGIDQALINITNMEAVRDDWFPGPAYRFLFTINARIQAKKWFEKEIFKILNIYPVIDADGKFNIKPFKPPLPATTTVQSFDEDNIIGIPSYDLNFGDLVNEVEAYYDWDDTDDEFDTSEFFIDSNSLNNRGPGKNPIKLESKGITTGYGGSEIFSRRQAKIFERYANPPPPKLNIQTWFYGWLTEAGDIVPITHSKLPDLETGTRGLSDERMEVINRSIDWKRGKVKLELLATAFEKNFYCQISPAATVTSGTSATEFEVSSADAAKFSVGDEVAIHKPNMTVQAASVTITDISGTTITTDNIGATPAAGWVMQYSAYDNCTTDQKLYWFASDGSDYLGTANDDAHLITA